MRRTSLASCLLLGLAACGKVQTATPDASVGPSVDANTTPDASVVGTVTVTVLDTKGSGTPVVNAPVVFLNADGSLVSDTHSDGNGVASAEMLAGGSVSTVVPNGTDFQVLTSLGVVPGDHILLGSAARDNASTGMFTVTNIPTVSSGYTATVYGPCGNTRVAAGATTASMNIYNYCKDSSTDLLIVEASGTTTYSILRPGIIFRGGGTESLAGSTWVFDSPMTASVTNLPGDLTAGQMARRTSASNGYDSATDLPVGQMSAALSVSSPQATSAYMILSMSKTQAASVQQVEKIAGQSHSYGVDASALLPWIAAVAADLTTGKITWTQAVPGGGDIMAVELQYVRGTTRYDWIVFGAPDQTSLTLPTLPSDVGGVNPTGTDTAKGANVYRVDLASVTGYAALREHPFAPFNQAFGDQASAETKIGISVGSAAPAALR
jgi:hypothetical protein